jgi:hypothetical protein
LTTQPSYTALLAQTQDYLNRNGQFATNQNVEKQIRLASEAFLEGYLTPFAHFNSIAINAASFVQDMVGFDFTFEKCFKELQDQLKPKWEAVEDLFRVLPRLRPSHISLVQPSISLIGYYKHNRIEALNAYRNALASLDFTSADILERRINELPDNYRSCIGGSGVTINSLDVVADELNMIAFIVCDPSAGTIIKSEWELLFGQNFAPQSWRLNIPSKPRQFHPPNTKVSHHALNISK